MANKPLITPLGQCIAEQDWDSQVDANQIRRGELIHCMARLDRLVDELDRLHNLPAIEQKVAVRTFLQRFQSELRDVKRSIYAAIAPRKEH